MTTGTPRRSFKAGTRFNALSTLFVATIERLLGRRVVTFIGGVDPDSEMSAEVFVLAPSESESGSQSRGLRDH